MQNAQQESLRLRIAKMEKRKSGFYWVKYTNSNVWRVCHYSSASEQWHVIGSFVYDDGLGEINENRIMSPDEW